MEAAHQHNKERLEKLNKLLDDDLERWHAVKKSDMKELIGGLASRNVTMYDKVGGVHHKPHLSLSDANYSCGIFNDMIFITFTQQYNVR